jgi:hypothetical protein
MSKRRVRREDARIVVSVKRQDPGYTVGRGREEQEIRGRIGRAKSAEFMSTSPQTQTQSQRRIRKRHKTHETGIKTNNKLIQLLFARFPKDVFHPGCRLIFFSGVNRPVVIRLTTLEGFLCG